MASLGAFFNTKKKIMDVRLMKKPRLSLIKSKKQSNADSNQLKFMVQFKVCISAYFVYF